MFTHDIFQYYSALGFPLFPCRRRDSEELKPDGKPVYKAKSPMTHDGFYSATCEMSQLEAWFKQFPDCVWGTPTSALRGVLDIDPKHDGLKRLEELEAKHGALPKTWRVRTGSGGLHYWFRWPEGTRSTELFGSAIGRKAEGGYVIVPPSRVFLPNHTQAYNWEVKPWECELADAPDWLLSLRSSDKQKASQSIKPFSLNSLGTLTGHPDPNFANPQFTPAVATPIGRASASAGSSPAVTASTADRCEAPEPGGLRTCSRRS